jgi:hypothetical protein
LTKKATKFQFTSREDFPLYYQLIDHVHHEGRIGDFARTGLLYVFETASKSPELERWIVESALPTLMASGLGAPYNLHSQCARRESRKDNNELGEIQLSTKHQLRLLDVTEALSKTFYDEVSIS